MGERPHNTHLVKVRVGLTLPDSVEVGNIHNLEVKPEASVSHLVLLQLADVRKVTQLLVPPTVQVSYASSSPTCIMLVVLQW